ncbi:sushi, von Willebrand factor type A, EGF and pentraxin domain-containing protein 1 [Lates japonicus]|uniref:Sushi, von Willebrand factor type A, EGF and pentraxin domain-containing protein 1 n=1 Tax=Lates japonicus TaxID=270547 RepID=A0AAD3NGX1_LATJO|nr:sushi, von Willebrand factor type A, EGF and pentraxin domain-containing protein 1 [Lates japonicus]
MVTGESIPMGLRRRQGLLSHHYPRYGVLVARVRTKTRGKASTLAESFVGSISQLTSGSWFSHHSSCMKGFLPQIPYEFQCLTSPRDGAITCLSPLHSDWPRGLENVCQVANGGQLCPVCSSPPVVSPPAIDSRRALYESHQLFGDTANYCN